jgi:hypothetical protein
VSDKDDRQFTPAETPSPDPEGSWLAIRSELARGAAPRPGWTRPVSRFATAAAAGLALALGLTAGVYRQFAAPASWRVVAIAGTASDGALAAGTWLETDAASAVRLDVGRIGTAEIGPESRVRMERGSWRAHRLELTRGRLSAVIIAPPRLFFVQTPSALATDLGCAYELTVGDDGASELLVTHGWVELAEGGRRSLVPEGMMAKVEPGGRPGSPHLPGLDVDARAALARLDAGSGSAEDLRTLTDGMAPHNARPNRKARNGVTLWHLIPRTDGALRAQVVQELAALEPLPAKVSTEGILALDRQMLNRWRRALHPMWDEVDVPLWEAAVRKTWTWLFN